VPLKRTKLSRNKRVKAVARKRVGSPKPGRPLTERGNRSRPKYKQQWQDEIES
jgi:hypothetical protein